MNSTKGVCVCFPSVSYIVLDDRVHQALVEAMSRRNQHMQLCTSDKQGATSAERVEEVEGLVSLSLLRGLIEVVLLKLG